MYLKVELFGSGIVGAALGFGVGAVKASGSCFEEAYLAAKALDADESAALAGGLVCTATRSIMPMLYGAAILSTVTLVVNVVDRVLPPKKTN